MPITAEQLFENYYFACLQVAGTPYKYIRSDIKVVCIAGIISISVWTVAGIPQPNDAYLMANCDMTTIGTIAASCTM